MIPRNPRQFLNKSANTATKRSRQWHKRCQVASSVVTTNVLCTLVSVNKKVLIQSENLTNSLSFIRPHQGARVLAVVGVPADWSSWKYVAAFSQLPIFSELRKSRKVGKVRKEISSFKIKWQRNLSFPLKIRLAK